MQIILNNGTVLYPIVVTGEKRYIQGANRDVLTFVFSDASMDELDSLFSEENCKSIRIIGDDDSEGIYKNYTIRQSITKKNEVVEEETSETPEKLESRIHVAVAQKSYTERQLELLLAGM